MHRAEMPRLGIAKLRVYILGPGIVESTRTSSDIDVPFLNTHNVERRKSKIQREKKEKWK